MASTESVQVLFELGFTGLEGEIYTYLLGDSPATGYRIAQAIGKPAANTYKALEALEQKGAILVDDGQRRLCRAIPYRELLAKLERNFEDRLERAEKVFAAIPASMGDERVYQVRTMEQVMERCRSMLERAGQVAIVDIFPKVLDELKPEIERCAGRGVDVTVKVYEPTEIAGVTLILDFMSDRILDMWPGQWVNMVIDAAEHLLAFLNMDCTGVYQAIWSSSPYLASTYQVGIRAEITLDEIGAVLARGGSAEEIREAFEKFQRPDMVRFPSYTAMVQRVNPEAVPHKSGSTKD